MSIPLWKYIHIFMEKCIFIAMIIASISVVVNQK